jgi:hypothetical protein
MSVRVLPAGTVQQPAREAFEPELGRIERGVLSGEDERRHQPMRKQRAGDGPQLDRFRPGPDDQPDIGGTQSPP